MIEFSQNKFNFQNYIYCNITNTVYNKNMNKNDLRYIKTEDIIREAFKKCVNEKGFKATRVCDICTCARISRNTFYAHYIDKYDLLDRLFDELQKEFSSSFTDEMGEDLFKSEFDSSIHWYMSTVSKNHDYYKMLLECSTDKFMKVAMDTIVINPMKKFAKEFEYYLDEDLKFRLNVNYMFQGMIVFTKIWLENFDDLSFEEASEEMKKLCFGPVSLFMSAIKRKMER